LENPAYRTHSPRRDSYNWSFQQAQLKLATMALFTFL
jgi:hypothetical protein